MGDNSAIIRENEQIFTFGEGSLSMNIPRFSVGDTLTLKKKHPCGCFDFEVLRTGSDIRIVCKGCGRDMTLSREKLEKAIKKITPGGRNEENDA